MVLKVVRFHYEEKLGGSPHIDWILTCTSDDVYHEIIDGRNVPYVELAYGLGKTIEMVGKGTMH